MLSTNVSNQANRARTADPALNSFDELPNSAFVAIPVVCNLFGCSTATVWRRVRDGQLPAPYRIGLRTTRWRVADLRTALGKVMREDGQ